MHPALLLNVLEDTAGISAAAVTSVLSKELGRRACSRSYADACFADDAVQSQVTQPPTTASRASAAAAAAAAAAVVVAVVVAAAAAADCSKGSLHQ